MPIIYYYIYFQILFRIAEVNLLCLYDLLHAAPELLTESHIHLLTPLSNSLKDVSETMRINVAQVYGILLAYGFKDKEFDTQVSLYIYIYIYSSFAFCCFIIHNFMIYRLVTALKSCHKSLWKINMAGCWFWDTPLVAKSHW